MGLSRLRDGRFFPFFSGNPQRSDQSQGVWFGRTVSIAPFGGRAACVSGNG
jgi:hypothetical protein